MAQLRVFAEGLYPRHSIPDSPCRMPGPVRILPPVELVSPLFILRESILYVTTHVGPLLWTEVGVLRFPITEDGVMNPGKALRGRM